METIATDVLVIGGGLAAMMAALEASELTSSVLIVSKAKVGNSGATLMAGSNFAAVLPEAVATGDRIELHVEDTILGGCRINDPRLVRTLAQNAPRDLLVLEKLGVQFLKRDGQFDIRKPPGHRNARTVFTLNPGIPINIRGKTITEPLRQALVRNGLGVGDGLRVIRLVIRDGCVSGVLAFRRKEGKIVYVQCKAAIIASGGAGALYTLNTNPGDLTGDSYSLALEAGCALRDMEFVQFYPCMHLGSPRIPIYSPTLSDGGVLTDRNGYRFMARYDPERMELATRDVVSQAIYREIQEGRGIDGGVYLDLTPIPAELLSFRFPDLISVFRKRGVDLHKEWIRVSPAAHFFMGGVVIDERCQTAIAGLFAAGETAGGLHGANRLSGNGLSEPLVFGRIAGKEAALFAENQAKKRSPPAASLMIEHEFGQEVISEARIIEIRKSLRRIMWEKVGIIRNKVGLARAVEELEGLRSSLIQGRPDSKGAMGSYFEVRSMLLAALAVAQSAILREESRGAHFRGDFPKTDQDMEKCIHLILDQGRMIARSVEVQPDRDPMPYF